MRLDFESLVDGQWRGVGNGRHTSRERSREAWRQRRPAVDSEPALVGIVEGEPLRLRIAHGVRVGRKRVERLMREAAISGLQRRKRGRTTVSVPGVRVADDLVERQFRPAAANVCTRNDSPFCATPSPGRDGGARTRPFTLPLIETHGGWVEILNTAHPVPRTVREGKVSVVAHSLMLLRYERPR